MSMENDLHQSTLHCIALHCIKWQIRGNTQVSEQRESQMRVLGSSTKEMLFAQSHICTVKSCAQTHPHTRPPLHITLHKRAQMHMTHSHLDDLGWPSLAASRNGRKDAEQEDVFSQDCRYKIITVKWLGLQTDRPCNRKQMNQTYYRSNQKFSLARLLLLLHECSLSLCAP